MIDATARFARRTAEACVGPWDRATTVAAMKRLGREQEQEVVKQIEQIQLEMLQEEDE